MFHFYLILRYTRNIPSYDDYDVILRFISEFQTAPFSDKIFLLFAHHNEHIILLMRVIALFSVYLFGGINFVYLIIFGNIVLLSIALTTAEIYGKKGEWYLFLPLVVLVLNLNSYENIFWAMASIANFGVILIVLLSLFFVSKDDRKSLLIGLSMALFATFSLGNGLLVLFLGCAILFYKKSTFKRITVWVIASIVCLIFYYWDYKAVGHHPGIINTLINDLDKMIIHFFIMLGNFASGWRLPLQIICGILAFVVLSYSFYHHRRLNTSALAFLSFLVLSCAAISLARGGFGIWWANTSRYMIYGNLIGFFLFLSAINTPLLIRFKFPLFLLLLLGSLGSYWMNFRRIDDIRYHTNKLEYSAASHHDVSKPEKAYYYPDQDQARYILAGFNEHFHYEMPKYEYPIKGPSKKPYDVPSFDIKVDAVDTVNRTYNVKGYFIIDSLEMHQVEAEFVISSSLDTVQYPTKKVFDFLRYESYGYKYGWGGFEVSIPKELINSDSSNIHFTISDSMSKRIIHSVELEPLWLY